MGYFQPMVIYRDPDAIKENSVLRYIGNRVLTKNANMLVGVTGGVGASKSWSCCSMAEMYAKMFGIDFNPEHHIISSLKELLELIVEPEKTRKIGFGSVIVFDEPQIEGNSRTWQSEVNQVLAQLISTFRNQRLVVFFATPFLENLDKQTRILFQGEFKVEGYDKKTKLSIVKPRFIEWNKKKDDFYRKRLIIQSKDKGQDVMNIQKLNYWRVPMASKEILDVYEAKKKRFSDDLNKKLLDRIKLSEKQNEIVPEEDKNTEFVKMQQLFDKYGEDYITISKEMPHLGIFTVEKYLFLIKKSKNLVNKRKILKKTPKKKDFEEK